MDFDDFEFNPMVAGLALLAAIFSLVVMSKVEVSIIYKIGSFIGTAIVSYFVVGKIFGD